MDVTLRQSSQLKTNGVNHTTGSNMPPTSGEHGLNGTTAFKRTQSLPAERRKARHPLPPDLLQPTIQENINQNESNISVSQHQSGTRMRRSFKQGRSFLKRKEDVRVSMFIPEGLNINDEIKQRLQNGEHNHLIPNGNTSYSSSSLPSQHKPKPTATNVIVRKLQDGVRRIGSLSEKHKPAALVTKVVEIVQAENEHLGIFIKRRRVPRQLENGATKFGIFVSRLDPACQVARDGLLHVGDQVLSVNTVEIVEPDVKRVAAMMCLPNRLVLKVRRSLKSSVRNGVVHPTQNHLGVSNHAQRGRMATLPEETTVESLPIPRYPQVNVEKKSATLNSMYDNDRADLSAPREILPVSSNPVRNSVQLKFDESLQILLDAIAGCEKPKNENNNCSSIANTQAVLSASNDLLNSETRSDGKSSGDADSLLDEILVEMGSPNRQNSLKVHRDINENSYIDVPSTSTSTEHSTTYFHTSFPSMFNDPDYDEVPTSDDESLYSTNEEVNIDLFAYRAKTSLRSANNQTLLESHAVSAAQPIALRRSFSDVSSNSSSPALAFPPSPSSFTPRFPVAHTDIEPSTPNRDTSGHSSPTVGITVDKKRHWLVNGLNVSDDLKLRLEATSKSEVKHRDTPVKPILIAKFEDNHSELSEKMATGNSKWFETRRTSASSSSSSANSNSSNSPSIPRSHKSSLDSPSSIRDFNLKRKSSLKSPIEKSAKSMLSVSSPFGTKTFFSSDKNVEQTATVSRPTKKEDKADASEKTVSAPTNLKKENHEDSPNQNKSIGAVNSLAANKITSPPRSRRKNWIKNFKKFKIGSSENTMSEYTCWTAEENEGEQPQYGNLLIPGTRHRIPTSSTPTTSSNRPRSINKSDFSVLNRYHLDISMAHQRRLSRQFLVDNNSQDPTIKPIAISQFKKYKQASIQNAQFLPPIEGCLVITLYGVRELKKAMCEACCLVQVDHASTKRIGTTMQTCRGSVAWNQCFEMTVSRARELHLTLYTWDFRGNKHKSSSTATVNLPTLVQGHQPNDPFSERLAIKLEPRGTLYVKVELEKNPSNRGPLVFGADLQSIVDREDSGLGIPTLAHSCIEEVEKRGMQVVGIYRLCGSAIVKRELRRQVEESKTATKLTADIYPDVNVITGILKDFLRELPQPLFPPELLEAVTTAMERNPGPTPQTVVKEPFAPNPTLTDPTASTGPQDPICDADQTTRTQALLEQIKGLSAASAERATLYALLNHLKKVAMHSGQNKMTCQNLAVCFGPVLLGPVNASLGNGIDLSAAIGFKRHIQVLNYMLSNWPDEPVPVPGMPKAPQLILPSQNGDVTRHSMNRVSCVSLTRRLSRVFVMGEGESPGEEGDPLSKRGTRISLGRSESLTSIVESADEFADPALDLCTQVHHQRQQASELSTQSQ